MSDNSSLPDVDMQPHAESREAELLEAVTAGRLDLVTDLLQLAPGLTFQHIQAAATLSSVHMLDALLNAGAAVTGDSSAKHAVTQIALEAGYFQVAARLLTIDTLLDVQTVHWCISTVATSPEGATTVLHLHKSSCSEEEFIIRVAVAADNVALLSQFMNVDGHPAAWQTALTAVALSTCPPNSQAL